MNMDVYPLIFKPIFKPKIWGGRTLQTLLDKPLPTDEPFGESWEIADLEDDQSIVMVGPAKGKTLDQLVKEWGKDLLGSASLFEGRFPLLIKFLDAKDTLSVQVHPDEAMAKRLGGRIRVKNEAWYVIDADENGFIYRGLKPGVDAAALQNAIDEQRVEEVLIHIPVRKGHCYYLPSGTIHALGAGVMVAEVQTPSDITYRVYDWNRVEASTGKPRELHLKQALECTSYVPVPPRYESSQHIASVWTSVTGLVHSESFVIERVRMVDGVEQAIPYEEMIIWIILEGTGSIVCDGISEPVTFKMGDTVLLPAGMKNGCVKVGDNCMWLEVSIPIKSSLAGFDRPEREGPKDLSGPTSRYITLGVQGKHPPV